MKFRKIAILTAVIVSLGTALAVFAEDKSALQDFLEIKVEKSIADEDYRSKQIPLTVSLINTGNTPLQVPQFDLNSPYEVSTFFRFNFLEEDNVTLHSSLNRNTKKHKKQEQRFVELAPGKSLDFSIEVSRIMFPRPEPGKYKVAVEYLNRNDKNKLIVVKCSPPLLLEIMGPDEKMREGYITKAEAIEIAKDAMKTIKHDESLQPQITLDRGIYTVIFPIYVPLGTFGPDHAGRVEIDAKSKKVVRVSMGS